jgi:hypothetical protein
MIMAVTVSLALIFFLIFLSFYFRLNVPRSALAGTPVTHGLPSFDLKNKVFLSQGIITLGGLLLFFYATYTITRFYFLAVPAEIYGGWDARYFWALKAKFMFRSPADWRLMFSPELPWSNQDYPLLWPGTLAWGWHWLGQESLAWGPFASFCFYISCVLLLVWYLAAYHSVITGCLAGSFALVLLPPLFWTLHQYADIPVTFFMTACILTLVTAFRLKNPGLFMISGLLGGLAAWTKNEGILFMVWIFLIASAILFFPSRKNAANAPGILKALTLGSLAPLLAVGILKYLSKDSGTYQVSSQDLQTHLNLFSSGAERAGMILRAFFDQMSAWSSWKGLWGFFVLAAILLGSKRKKGNYAGILLAAAVLVNAGYFAVLLITSPDLAWQIRTALDRLVIHSSILATAFVFEMLTSGQSVPSK